MARKRKSKPTSKQRSAKQRIKDRYAHAREDAQLAGLIPTTPEESLKDERVDPSTQGEQALPSLDRMAVREDGGSKGWRVPDPIKRKVIDRLAEPFFTADIAVDKDGNQVPKPPDRHLLKENAKVLLQADQKQYERDNPDEAGKARGGGKVEVSTNVNNSVVIDPYQLFKQMLSEVQPSIPQASIPQASEDGMNQVTDETVDAVSEESGSDGRSDDTE